MNTVLELTPEAINQRFKEAVRSLQAEHGTYPPHDLLGALQEQQRQEWVQYVAQRDGTPSPEAAARRRHVTKTEMLRRWLSTQIGQVVTPDQMGAAVGASKATGHAFINDNRSMFAKVRPGQYEVLDVEELRRGAGRPVAKTVAKPVAVEVKEIEDALAAVTGHGDGDEWGWMK